MGNISESLPFRICWAILRVILWRNVEKISGEILGGISGRNPDSIASRITEDNTARISGGIPASFSGRFPGEFSGHISASIFIRIFKAIPEQISGYLFTFTNSWRNRWRNCQRFFTRIPGNISKVIPGRKDLWKSKKSSLWKSFQKFWSTGEIS